jgi:hypothetical protein
VGGDVVPDDGLPAAEDAADRHRRRPAALGDEAVDVRRDRLGVAGVRSRARPMVGTAAPGAGGRGGGGEALRRLAGAHAAGRGRRAGPAERRADGVDGVGVGLSGVTGDTGAGSRAVRRLGPLDRLVGVDRLDRSGRLVSGHAAPARP